MPQSDRATAADTMLAHERMNETKTEKYMRVNGLPSDIDVAEMEAFVLNVSEDNLLKIEATNLTHAVKGTGMNLWTVYRLWREDSTWAHATGFLAGKYAPISDDDTMGKGNPSHIDRDLEAHRLVAVVLVISLSDILTAEGVVSELAGAPMMAYFETK